MTDYRASKNKKFYYKCNTRGYKNNQRADEVHENFKTLLSYFTVNPSLKDVIQEMLSERFSSIEKDAKEQNTILKKKLTEIENKIEKLEEKYLFEDVSKDVYQKHLSKLQTEKSEISKQLSNPHKNLSNLESEWFSCSKHQIIKPL